MRRWFIQWFYTHILGYRYAIGMDLSGEDGDWSCSVKIRKNPKTGEMTVVEIKHFK